MPKSHDRRPGTHRTSPDRPARHPDAGGAAPLAGRRRIELPTTVQVRSFWDAAVGGDPWPSRAGAPGRDAWIQLRETDAVRAALACTFPFEAASSGGPGAPGRPADRACDAPDESRAAIGPTTCPAHCSSAESERPVPSVATGSFPHSVTRAGPGADGAVVPDEAVPS